MFLAHKIELRPTKQQEQLLLQCCGVKRFVYNKVCPECGFKIDRDINAAINLRKYYASSLDGFEPDYNRLEEFCKTAVPCSLNVDARNFNIH